ncbi:MFS transporter [Herbiconiux sp. KACC 21604]|uniref:MFS transporter n=1 Tax=unclassified Herbiconiux TaxID=2618217 RepID=UPI0020A2FD8D|nr:MFS transporter [Herbiconiux sp. SALV-R1]WPO87016.1 MFS transporter [Herbiconiux sp. KACC 21604]
MVFTLAFTGLVTAFMMTLLVPLVPSLPEILDVSAEDSQWAVTVTLLAAAVATPIFGRLGDLYGKRRMVLVLLGLVVLGSVIAGFATTLVPLVIGRGLQGAGIGVIPLGISILRDVLHRDRVGAAVALVSATLGIGGAVGLPLAAVISQFLDWHILFVVSGVLAVAGFVLVWRFIPVSTLRAEGQFDAVGAIGLAVALTALLLGISKGNGWGWVSLPTLACLVGGVVVLALWTWYELRSASPLIDIRVATRRTVLLTNAASVTVGFAFFASTVVLPQLLEASTGTGVGLGQSMFVASLCLIPSGLVMWAVSGLAARLIRARGARLSFLLGLAVIAVGYLLAVFLMTEIWHTVLIATVVGLGVGFAYSAMPTLIMGAVPPTETAASNGLNSVMRSLGSTVASAVFGVVLATQTVTVGDVTTPSAWGFQLSFIVSLAAAAVGVLLVMLIPRRHSAYGRASLPDGD